MKFNYLTLTFIFTTAFSFAQLYVSPNSYVFADNQVLFVKQDVELNASTSNLYLRNGAQLIQGTSTAGTNKGLGDLSVYQEGTVNNFLYNYWCSPVGNTLIATAINNPFGVSQLKQVTGLTTFSNPILLPVGTYDGLASPLSIAQRWIYTFTTSNAYAQWNYIGGANTIAAGSGFTMKGTTGGNQQYDFRGKPNDGIITSAVSTGNFTLIGNPYPSAIDLNLFIAANSSVIDGRILFWEQANVASHIIAAYQGGYGTYTAGSGYTAAPFWNYNAAGSQTVPTGGSGTVFTGRRFSPIGQGFMVQGTANALVGMTNSFRIFQKEDATSQFARSTTNYVDEYYPEILNNAGIDYTQVKKGHAPQFKINAMFNNGGVRPTTLAFRDDFTDGVDYSADAAMSSGQAADFYYVINNNEYLANALKFDIDKRVPVGLKCDAETNFKIKVVDVLYGFDANQNVYIHDKTTGVYTDIKNGTFEIVLPAGDNRTRFEITFKQENLSTNQLTFENFTIFQNDTSGNITIRNPKNVDLKSISVFDVSGKSVFNSNALGTNSQYEFSSSNLSKGVYIVKLITVSNQEITTKLAINNKM